MKARIWNIKGWIEETSPEALMELFEPMLTKAGFTVIHITQQHFQPQGFTSLFLLGESHFALHTFPEETTTYFELSSCVEEPFKRFVKLLYP
jgi:S-adenosylmethionine decarboxylase